MPEQLLQVPSGYDPHTQAVVGVMAAGLDDQTRRLRQTLAGLGVEHLQWQERPGRNTIGMLLTHLAGAEIGWLYIVHGGLSEAEGERVMRQRLGRDLARDRGGMPLPADGVHPSSLEGVTLEEYFDLMSRARSATHDRLRTWDDASLDAVMSFGPLTVSHRWVLYHLVEHFAAHHGQILSLLHCMRDHDVPGLPEGRPGL